MMSVLVLASLAIVGQVAVVDGDGNRYPLADGAALAVTDTQSLTLAAPGRTSSCALFDVGGEALVIDATAPALFRAPGLSCVPADGGVICRRDGVLAAACLVAYAAVVEEAPPARSEPAPAGTVDVEKTGLAKKARPQVYIARLESDPELAETALVITDLLTAELASSGLFTVVSAADIEAMVRNEERRQQAGCTDEATCLGDIAAMFGAEYLVSGRVTTDGQVLSTSLRLTRTEDAVTVTEVPLDARDIASTSRRMNGAVFNLTAPVTGAEPVTQPPPYLGRTMTSPGTLFGAAATALSVVAATAPLGLLTAGLLVDFPAIPRIVPPLVPLFAIVPATLLAAIALAVAADLLSGAAFSFKRAALIGGAALGSSVVFFGAAYVASTALAATVYTQDGQFDPDRLSEALIFSGYIFLGTGAIGTLLTAAAVGTTYIGSVGVFGDDPLGGELE